MSDLATIPLGTLADLKRGITYTESALCYCPEDGIPYVNMKSFLKDGGFNNKGLKYYTGFYTDQNLVGKSDLLIANTDVTREGDIIGVPVLIQGEIKAEKILYSHHVTRLRFDNDQCMSYLFYLFCTDKYRREMKKYARGTTVLMLDMEGLQRISVSFHSNIAQQQKIARILQTIDQVIEKTEALIDKYQQIKAGLMHDLFTRGIGPDGQLRPPREQAPHLYQQTPIGWIPKEWEVSKLRDMARSGVPHIKTGPFGSSLKGEHWVTDGVPVITIGALGEGDFIHDELLFINENHANHLADYRMKKGEVVFSRVADVGRSVVIEKRQEGWVMSSNLMRIHLDSDSANSHFLQHLLSFDSRVKNQIRCKVNSGGRDVANSEVLNSIIFAWPKIDEQEEIVSLAFSINRKMSKEKESLENLKKQKSGLMHDLLTGKVQVEIDPVSDPEAAHG